MQLTHSPRAETQDCARKGTLMDMPRIILLDRNVDMVAAWEESFKDESNVTFVQDEFARFMDEHPEIDCIVSPANSYGIMDGGFDLALLRHCGNDLMHVVQRRILDAWFGEQPVGTSLSVKFEGVTLIHTPTMRVPSRVVDPMVVYHAMRSTLIEALRIDARTVVVPAFGAGCGTLSFDVVAKLMAAAYHQVANPPKRIDWEYANSRRLPDSRR